MNHIIEQLLEIKSVGGYICPHMYDLFKPYRECSFDKIRVVIITSLKSNDYGHHGLPFCQDILPIRNLLTDSIGKNARPLQWGKDGVLQLSTAMTSTLNAQHHYDIWAPWMAYVINKINENYPECIWIVVGKDAEKYRAQIKSPYKKTIKLWPYIEDNKVWEWANKQLTERKQQPIQWSTVKKVSGAKASSVAGK